MEDEEAFRQPRLIRLIHVLERDGARCIWCGRALVAADPEATLDHLIPRLKGGPTWPENELAACRSCNGARGHFGPVQWLRVCDERGWHPDRAIIKRQLEQLELAIERRGGQRR